MKPEATIVSRGGKASSQRLANWPVPRYFMLVNRGLYVVMGVSGSGKSRIGAALADALGVEFVEGDDFHPAENIARMKSGIALTDQDRRQWLRSLAARIRAGRESGKGIVISCSALKRPYRDVLRAEAKNLRFILLSGSRQLITARVTSRGESHFMPLSLVDSQLETLEEPSPEEDAWTCDIAQTPDEIVAAIVARIHTSAEPTLPREDTCETE